MTGRYRARCSQMSPSLSAVCCYAGEDYLTWSGTRAAGFTTPAYRQERVARTREIAKFAHALGISAVSCHIGFIPADPADPLPHTELPELTRVLCDGHSRHGQDALFLKPGSLYRGSVEFIADVDRSNL